MSSQNTNLEIIKSKKLPDWAAEKLTANEIIAVCIDKIVKNEYDDYCIFEYGLTKILSSQRLKEVGTDYMQQFLTTLLNHISKILSDHQHSLSANEELLNLVAKIKEFLLCLNDLFAHIHIRTVYIAIEMALRLVEQIFLFFNNSKELAQSSGSIFMDSLNQILCESQTLQHVTISIIANNLQCFICYDVAYVPDITRILNCLCSFGEFLTLMDVKLTSAIWKCITRLGTEYSTLFKENHISWLEKPVKVLCEEISQGVTTIYENYHENDQNTKKLERILKVNSFYLKVIIKFSTDYEHQYFQGCEYVVKLWILLNCCPENIEKQVAVPINQYLTVGMMNLVSQIYKNQLFIQALSDVDINSITTFRSYLRIFSEIVQLIIGSNDNSIATVYFLRNGNKTMIDKILEKISIHKEYILKKETHESLVTTIAATFISTSSIPKILKYYETKLVREILQNNISSGFICYDIWCIIFRFANPETRLRYFRFWLKCISNRAIFSTCTSNAVFIDVLVKTLYTILSEKQKELVWRENGNSHEDIVKLSFVLGTENISNSMDKDRVVSKCITNLDSNLSVLLQTPSKESYYEVAKNLHILSIENLQIDPNLSDKIESVYMRLAYCKLRNNSLLKSLIYFAQKCKNFKLISKVLHDLPANTFSENIKFYAPRLINTYVNADKRNRELISKIINSNITVDKLLLIYYAYYLPHEIPIRCVAINQSEIENNVIKENYFQALRTLNLRHLCSKRDEIDSNDNCNDDSNPAKRLKRDQSNILLDEAAKNVEKLHEYFRNREPDEAEVAQIEQIINTFSKIVRNKITS